MDSMVLAAQEWVNETYTGVAGYIPCQEDGKTAWSTMYSLTRALQHELGITTLSNSFGPTTLSRLSARGNVTADEDNRNIVKIVQSALWCKGYNGGVIDGLYRNTTQDGVTRMLVDAGVYAGSGEGVAPKTFKALLTMDAYVLVYGGDSGVRSVQQWLNSRYLSRRDFFISPCDGLYSRDVQKALLKAIQFELGMTDDQATGSFGPATQSGLRSHPVQQGTSGVWAQLLTAAMVFNRYGTFVRTFDAASAERLRAFQEFSELAGTGSADFATWAQLLVSTGDPTRPGTASDCITTVTAARGRSLFDAGYRFVGRYLDNVQSSNALDKKIKPGELATIFGAGLAVFPISQYSASSVDYFTFDQGYIDGVKAHDAAKGHGFGRGTVLYFAVDYDATQQQIDDYVVPYFRGVVGGLTAQGKRYLHGVYGSRNVCAEVSRTTAARWSFVSGMSTGFSGNLGYTLPDNWSFNQIQTTTVGSGDGRIEIDKNVHRRRTDPGVRAINQPPTSVRAAVEYVEHLYALAVRYGQGDPNRQVLDYLRSSEYDDSRWTALIGAVDEGFVDYVEANATLPRVVEFTDPQYGVPLGLGHFAASTAGLVVHGNATGDGVNAGDFAGWGGDLLTLYGEWRRENDSYSSGYVYCQERFAQTSELGSFKLSDLIEDADANYVGNHLLSRTADIGTLVRGVWLDGLHRSRLSRFLSLRFTDSSQAFDIAANMLTVDFDAKLSAFKVVLIQSMCGACVTPDLLPRDQIDAFINGFVDVLSALAAQEGLGRRP